MAIISYRHKFIFVKTRKTAGTSLEVHLAAKCGPKDIVTPIAPTNPDHQPRNFEGDGGVFKNHMAAREIQRLKPRAFESFFKFCFERHPIDKCLSQFAMFVNAPWFDRPGAPQDWDAYLAQRRFPVDVERYTDASGALIVDRVFRYEDLPGALAEIERRVGTSFGPLTANEKSGYRHGVPTFDEVNANPEQRRVIMDAFAPSLRHTHYD
jgi:hypothetical protein